jgi:hypothetical protein
MFTARKSAKEIIAVFTTQANTTWLIGLKCGEKIDT